MAGRPIVLRSKDGHGYWVSNVVLQAMEPIPDEVEGGVIMRDSSGQPNGASTRVLVPAPHDDSQTPTDIRPHQASSWTSRATL